MAGIEDVIGQVVQQVMKDPAALTQFMEHPYSTVGKLTGNDNVSAEEAAQVVTGVSALAQGQSLDLSALAGQAASLLSQNGDSVHALAGALLGGGSAEGGASADVLSGLAGMVSGGGIPGVDLSDGLGVDDLMGFASAILGGKK